MREVAVHMPAAEPVESLEHEEPDDTEDPILDAHVREELAAPGSRDLLREGQTHAT